MSLSPKEMVYAQIRHEETEVIPYTLGFEGDVAERLDGYYGSDAWREVLDNAIRRIPSPELVVDWDRGPLVTDDYGTTWRIDQRPFHLETPALPEPTLDGYTFPDVDTMLAKQWDREAALAAAEEDEDHFLVVGFGFGIFERIWTLRGFENALMDAGGDPDFYGELAAAVAEHQIAILERLVTLPVDGIMFSDDWGYQRGVLLGPERWRRFLKPHLARMYELVHGAGKVTLSHCCGSIASIMPDLIDIGLDVYESVQPEARDNDPYALKAQFGGAITFWGGLGSQSTVPHGTPAGIKTEVNRLCQEMGRGGGYILSTAKALQPETPVENAAAVVEAFLAQAGQAESLKP
jgi:uroporphyrinogen decarboxylase